MRWGEGGAAAEVGADFGDGDDGETSGCFGFGRLRGARGFEGADDPDFVDEIAETLELRLRVCGSEEGGADADGVRGDG